MQQNVLFQIENKIRKFIKYCFPKKHVPRGCSSQVGYQNGVQIINLADECFTNTGGTIQHEIMHSKFFLSISLNPSQVKFSNAYINVCESQKGIKDE